MGIGLRLKEAREAKNITLDELQEETKIQKRYLTAIENEQFEVLPGKFYAKAFIREYASAVDLDGNQLMSEFGFDDSTIETEDETPTSQSITRAQRAAKKSSSTNFSIVPTIIVVLLIIGIIVVAWTLIQKSSSDKSGDVVDTNDEELVRDEQGESETGDGETSEGEGTSEEDEADAPEDEPEADEDIDISVIENGEGSSAESILGIQMTDDERVLTLEATEEVYVEVKGESGEAYFVQMFNQEESPKEITLTEDKVYLNIGNSTALKLSINGEPIDYPNEKVHQKLWLHFNPSTTE
ncbi:MAG TPA: RodZ domain-containing protein [Bacillota bacterium]|nr:RodZ domain-containing protein [Bacillota bacterium]